MKTIIALSAFAGLAVSAAQATPIDTLSPGQIANGPVAVQNTQTSFGGNNFLGAAYYEVDGGNLNLMFVGRLGTGNERLAVFFDVAPGGANVLPGGQFGLNNAGMRFDAAFTADHSIVVNVGGTTMFMDRNTYDAGGNLASSAFEGANPASNGGGVSFGSGLRASVNNAGYAGPFGFGLLNPGDIAGILGNNAGIGLSVPLALLGVNIGDTIRISAMILGGDGATMSTQVLGGVNAGIANYPNSSQIDFNQIEGNQYFTIPAPGAAALMGLGLIAAGRRRR